MLTRTIHTNTATVVILSDTCDQITITVKSTVHGLLLLCDVLYASEMNCQILRWFKCMFKMQTNRY